MPPPPSGGGFCHVSALPRSLHRARKTLHKQETGYALEWRYHPSMDRISSAPDVATSALSGPNSVHGVGPGRVRAKPGVLNRARRNISAGATPAKERPMNIRARQHPGFSLIELLTVMVIIALVVAIVIPTLGRARDSARSTSTQSFVQRFVQAAEQFQQDHRRLPGYFTMREMGAAQNVTRGFSAIQNMLLDLSGGVVTTGGTPGVGPLNNPASQIRVNRDLIGVPSASNKAYFTPSAKNLAFLSVSTGERVGVPEHEQVPELVDDYGMALIAWVQDDAGQASVRRPEDFVAEDSRTPSRFYWAANAAILSAPATGRLKIDMAAQSLIGRSDANGLRSLRGLLGNPAYPVDANVPVDQILPSAARGPLVVMSAGRNGVFLGREERGAKSAAGPLDYGLNFKTRQGAVLNPRVDVLTDFDDIVVAGGH